MSSTEPSADDPLRSAVRQILLSDWDPHEVSRNPAAHGSYDAYISPLLDLIRTSDDEGMIVQFLQDRESETMCFPSLGTRRLMPVARKLLALRADFSK